MVDRKSREDPAPSKPKSAERALLKRTLLQFDRLDALAGRPSERDGVSRFDAETAQAREHCLTAIASTMASLETTSALGSLIKRYKLDAKQFAVLLALIRRRLTADDPFVAGRELLMLLFESSFDLLQGSSLLDGAGILVASGLVQIDAATEGDDDPLRRRFRASERLVRTLRGALASETSSSLVSRSKASPYRTNLQLLMDLRRLSLLYRARATLTFRVDSWSDLGVGSSLSISTVKKNLVAHSSRIRESLEISPRRDEFPLVSTRREFSLGDDEMVVLVTLLFQELREGAAFLDCVDVLRLVSESEEDLVRKRRFLGKRSPLVRHNLIAIEEVVADKELTGEAYLPNWVIDRLLGDEDKAAIDADSRIDFHDYLKDLDSSDPFFDDLGSAD
jgi:hypothetical protein